MSATGFPFRVTPRRADPSELRWAKRLDDLELGALEKVRGTAEKWAASLVAILGLASTVLVVKGRDDITKLATGWQIAVAVLLGLTFLLGAIAIYLAALAAQGTPKKLDWPTPNKLRKWERDEALKAQTNLRRSRGLTIAVAACSVLAIGCTWFGESAPTDPPSPASVLVVPAAGAPVCGQLAAGPAGVSIRTSRDAPVTAIEAGQIAQVVPVSACP